MPVKVKCSGCSAVLNVPDKARGKAVKCPKCGKGIRVPAGTAKAGSTKTPPARSSRPKPARRDDDDFLAGFDLGHVEDRSARVCPKCGAIAGDEDIDCPVCGADMATGGLGVTQRARAKRKGAAPSEFYSAVFGDAFEYLGNKLGLVWKSTLILTIFPILALISSDFITWCHNWPTKLFWVFVGTICGLITPGWIWYVQNQFILRILETKRERYPVRFEAFGAVALGIKAVCWSLFFGLPIWLFLGGIGVLLAFMGSPIGAAIAVLGGVFLFVVIMYISWPIVHAHFAMPITWPGWMIHKVLPDVAKNLGPSLYIGAVMFGLALPIVGVSIGGNLFVAPKHQTLVDALAAHSRVNKANQTLEEAEENHEEVPEGTDEIAKEEPPEIDWTLLLWPCVMFFPIAILQSVWLVLVGRMSALYVKLFRPNIENLITEEKEYVYTPMSPLEKEALEEERGPLTPNSVKTFALVGVVFAALGGVSLAMSIGAEAGYVASFAASFGVVGSLLNSVASLLILIKAFRTGPMWGISLLIPIVNTISFFLFLAKEAKRTVYEFQLWLFSIAFMTLSGALWGLWMFLAIRAAAAEAEEKQAEEAAMLVLETLSRLC